MSRDEKSRRVGFMTRALTHRGPDDEGFFDDRQVSLGFRRLSVIDFASEIRALLAGGFPSCRDLDPAELRHYLALGYSSPGGTVLRDVRSVAPASVLNIDADGNATSHRVSHGLNTNRRQRSSSTFKVGSSVSPRTARRTVKS